MAVVHASETTTHMHSPRATGAVQGGDFDRRISVEITPEDRL